MFQVALIGPIRATMLSNGAETSSIRLDDRKRKVIKYEPIHSASELLMSFFNFSMALILLLFSLSGLTQLRYPIQVTFEETSKMSTYLLAFVVGDFNAIEGQLADGKSCKVYATGHQVQPRPPPPLPSLPVVHIIVVWFICWSLSFFLLTHSAALRTRTHCFQAATRGRFALNTAVDCMNWYEVSSAVVALMNIDTVCHATVVLLLLLMYYLFLFLFAVGC